MNQPVHSIRSFLKNPSSECWIGAYTFMNEWGGKWVEGGGSELKHNNNSVKNKDLYVKLLPQSWPQHLFKGGFPGMVRVRPPGMGF